MFGPTSRRQVAGRIADPEIIFGRRRRPLPPPVEEIEHMVVVNEDTFWGQYVNSLNHQNWNPEAINQLEAKVDEILGHVDLGEDGRTQRASIIGEVQSGKTASMIGLAAKGLDLGFKLIIVLAGHQNDLRNQTSKRFNKDLLLISEKIGQESSWTIDRTPPRIRGVQCGIIDDENYSWSWLGGKRAYGLPSHCDINKCEGHIRQQLIEIRNGSQGVLVIKKNQHAMDACMNLLTEVLRDVANNCPIMVIDDESDYATMPPPNLQDERVWRPMVNRNWNLLTGYDPTLSRNPDPRHPLPPDRYFNVYAFDYTATPQLPHRQPEIMPNGDGGINIFFNRHHHVLRSASDVDNLIEYDSNLPRYGKYSWYTGPEMFYGRYTYSRPPLTEPDQEIHHPTPNLNSEDYADPEGVVFELTSQQLDGSNEHRFECGLMSFFAAGAIRFAQQNSNEGGSSDNLRISLNPNSDLPWPETHSALIHHDYIKNSHWNQTSEVMRIFGDFRTIDRNMSTHYVNPNSFRNWLKLREQELHAWFEYFKIKYDQVVADGAYRPDFPDLEHYFSALQHWADHVKIKVINSDPNPKIPLDFDVRCDDTGAIIRPEDVYTIIIGGNSLSRGLTIDGLCTTIFGRLARQPNQATMMQHQRWCGFRAHYWEFVTLHIGEEELRLMSAWSAADQVDRMSHAGTGMGALRLTVPNAEGRPILGAGKLPRPVPLNLVGDYQFRHVELENAKINEEVMVDFIEHVLGNPHPHAIGNSHIVNVTNPMDSLDVADLLDRLEYTNTGTNWQDSHYDLGQREYIALEGIRKYFKGAGIVDFELIKSNAESSVSYLPMNQNPKLVAAYLRLWHLLYHHGADLITHLNDNELFTTVGSAWIEGISAPPVFNLVFQGGNQRNPVPDEPMHPIFSDQRLISIISNPIRKAAYRSENFIVNQMRTGNRVDLPGGNRYVDLHLGDNSHPAWVQGHLLGYRYTRQQHDRGVLIGQVFERAHLYNPDNRYGVPSVECDPNHIPISFMIDIPMGGPSFIIT